MLGDRWETDRTSRTLSLIGRLRDGVTREQAQQDLQATATAIAREFTPQLQPTIEVQPGTLVAGGQRRLATMFLSLLLGLVALVLVIAAANVGNMLLARVIGRRRELAIRVALGASGGQLARLLLVESSAIAVAGGTGALLLSLWTSRLFANISPLPTLTLRLDLRPDARVVLFTAVAAIAAAAILGGIATAADGMARRGAGAEGRRHRHARRQPAAPRASRPRRAAGHRVADPAHRRGAVPAQRARSRADRSRLRPTRRRRDGHRRVARTQQRREPADVSRRAAAPGGTTARGHLRPRRRARRSTARRRSSASAPRTW